MVRAGDEYWVAVEVTLQLRGFDPSPVVTRDRFRFAAAEDGRYVVSSVTDRRWEKFHDVWPQPWDMVPIEVRARDGVLGIFDEQSVFGCRVRSWTRSRKASTTSPSPCPMGWSRAVVVYALSDIGVPRVPRRPAGQQPGARRRGRVPGAVRGPAQQGGRDPVRTAPLDAPAARPGAGPARAARVDARRGRGARRPRTRLAERGDRRNRMLAAALAPELRRLPEEALGAAEAGIRRLPADEHVQRQRVRGALRGSAGGPASTSLPASGSTACGSCSRTSMNRTRTRTRCSDRSSGSPAGCWPVGRRP